MLTSSNDSVVAATSNDMSAITAETLLEQEKSARMRAESSLRKAESAHESEVQRLTEALESARVSARALAAEQADALASTAQAQVAALERETARFREQRDAAQTELNVTKDALMKAEEEMQVLRYGLAQAQRVGTLADEQKGMAALLSVEADRTADRVALSEAQQRAHVAEAALRDIQHQHDMELKSWSLARTQLETELRVSRERAESLVENTERAEAREREIRRDLAYARTTAEELRVRLERNLESAAATRSSTHGGARGSGSPGVATTCLRSPDAAGEIIGVGSNSNIVGDADVTRGDGVGGGDNGMMTMGGLVTPGGRRALVGQSDLRAEVARLRQRERELEAENRGLLEAEDGLMVRAVQAENKLKRYIASITNGLDDQLGVIRGATGDCPAEMKSVQERAIAALRERNAQLEQAHKQNVVNMKVTESRWREIIHKLDQTHVRARQVQAEEIDKLRNKLKLQAAKVKLAIAK